MTKVCTKCGKEKDVGSFYRHKTGAGGYNSKCKKCTKKAVKEYRARNIERVRAYDRRRGGTGKRIEANTKRTQKYRKMFPLRYKALCAVNNAVRDGRLTKPKTCQVCGGIRQIEGHHDDYSKPLEVRWLCSVCHSRLHADLRKK